MIYNILINICIIFVLCISLHDLIFALKYKKRKWHYKDGTISDYEFRYVNKDKILHRIGKPAVIFDSCETYYENGLKHRLNGPAVIIHDTLFTTAAKMYYIYGYHLGNNLSKKEFERLKNIKLKEVAFS